MPSKSIRWAFLEILGYFCSIILGYLYDKVITILVLETCRCGLVFHPILKATGRSSATS